jgi:hypothetical protein
LKAPLWKRGQANVKNPCSGGFRLSQIARFPPCRLRLCAPRPFFLGRPRPSPRERPSSRAGPPPHLFCRFAQQCHPSRRSQTRQAPRASPGAGSASTRPHPLPPASPDHMRILWARGRDTMDAAISVATMKMMRKRERFSVLGSFGSPRAQAETNPPKSPPIWA